MTRLVNDLLIRSYSVRTRDAQRLLLFLGVVPVFGVWVQTKKKKKSLSCVLVGFCTIHGLVLVGFWRDSIGVPLWEENDFEPSLLFLRLPWH